MTTGTIVTYLCAALLYAVSLSGVVSAGERPKTRLMAENASTRALVSHRAKEPGHLRCEYLVNPLGVDSRKPRLSWVMNSGQRGDRQTAYQVLVASTPELLAREKGDLWDSGKVESDRTIHVVYDGRPLTSRARCHWKVRIWDKQGNPTPWSAPAMWAMGLFEPADWGGAAWIGTEDGSSHGAHNGYCSGLVDTPDSERWITLDLGKPRRIDGTRLWPARPFHFKPDRPGFLFPVRFKIEGALNSDFSDAETLVDRTKNDVPSPGGKAPIYRFSPMEVRYVRLSATRLRKRPGTYDYGLALAEMHVLSDGRNVAKDATVTALDSFESGEWSTRNLVDGRTKTDSGQSGLGPALTMRKSFHVSGPIVRATAYASGLGLYELRLNGRRVGNRMLAPEWTTYRKRVQYQAYDVTNLLVSGDNAVGAILGDGWNNGRIRRTSPSPYSTRRGLILRLDVESADGAVQTVVSDTSWRGTREGPIRASTIFDGEIYDARRELPRWDQPGFDDRTWQETRVAGLFADANLVWQPNEPIRVTRELKPVNLTEPKPGVYVFDTGQNMVGWCRLKVRGPAGNTVKLRHAERLNPDGTIYTAHIRPAKQTEIYTKGTDGEETYEPHFTYHGFRYVELTGTSEKPQQDDLLGRVFHSASPEAGRFKCSNTLVNKIVQMIEWTQRGNMHGVPTDCPQRDERQGWMGDIQAFSQTAVFNRDMAAFFNKWIVDIRDNQDANGRYPRFAPGEAVSAPAWSDAGTIVPWRVYQNYADTRLVQEHFESARRWVDYVHERNPNLLWERAIEREYGDWLNADTFEREGSPESGAQVPIEVLATAFFANSAEIVSKMAGVLGRAEEETQYRKLAEGIRRAFAEAYVEPNGRIKGDTQAGYVLALHFNMLPDDLRPKAAKHMVEGFARYDGHLSTGIQATHRLMLELTRNGYTDEAYRLLNLRSMPSWGYMVDQGATTIWERWDGYVEGRGFADPKMNSFNHYVLGSVGEWIWRHIAGLNPDDEHPGWKHFTIAPLPHETVTWAEAEYNSIRGPIKSDWKVENGRITMKVTIPPNTTATVRVPTTDAKSVEEGGQAADKAVGVRFLRAENDAVFYEVESGDYVFAAPR